MLVRESGALQVLRTMLSGIALLSGVYGWHGRVVVRVVAREGDDVEPSLLIQSNGDQIQ